MNETKKQLETGRSSGITYLYAAVLAVVFLVYLPVLHHGFVNWDDDVSLLDNAAVRGLNFEHLRDQWAGTVNRTYVPLTEFSFALEYRLFGYQPFIYHLDNLLLHLLVTFLVMVLAGRLGLAAPAAAMAGLIFGLHPLHVESVAWVTERKDVLYAAFYMLSLVAYVNYLTRGRKGWFFLSLAMGILSMLSKPMAISLPFILILVDWYRGRKDWSRALLEKMYFVAGMAPIAWFTYFLSWQVPRPGYTFWDTVLFQTWCVIFYIRQFFWPKVLTLFYYYPMPITLHQAPYAASLIAAVLLMVALVVFRRYKILLWAAGYFFLSIFFLLRQDPTRNLNIVADRFMYLPSLGLCMLLADAVWKGLERTAGRKWLQRIACAGVGLVFLLMAARTFAQCRVWQNGVTLWSYQIQHNPRIVTAMAYTKLGQAMMQEERFRALIARQTLPPGSVPPEQYKQDLNALDEIFRCFDLAIKVTPQYPYSYYYKARIFYDMGQLAPAAQILGRALRLNPDFADFYVLSGKIDMAQGFPERAVERFRRAIQVQPRYEYVYVQILEALAADIGQGDRPEIYRVEREKVRQQLDQLKRSY